MDAKKGHQPLLIIDIIIHIIKLKTAYTKKEMLLIIWLQIQLTVLDLKLDLQH